METFGAYLKAHREKKGIRLEEIASITKIHLHTLELLEASQWDKLPPEPFIRGFIVAYGKYIGLDPKELLERYTCEVSPQEAEEPEEMSTPQDDARLRKESPGNVIEHSAAFSSRKIATTLSVILIVGVLLGIIYLGKRATQKTIDDTEVAEQASETAETPPPVVEESVDSTSLSESKTEETTEKGEASKQAESVEASPSPEQLASKEIKPESAKQLAKAPPEVKDEKSDSSSQISKKESAKREQVARKPVAAIQYKHSVSIEGKERTWIKIVIDNKQPIEYFLPEGNKVSYKAQEKIKVVLGNSTGSKVYHNGKLSGGVKFLGTIRSYKFPEDAQFPQDVSSKRAPSSRVMNPNL